MSGAFRLEALGAAARVVSACDAATGEFAFAAKGRFWRAIEHAHALGARGAGRKVAIIDTMCDLSLPLLKQRIDVGADHPFAAAPAAQLSHGTAVALLIARVAPDCRFDLYPMLGADGQPDIALAARGIMAAARSDAAVINLSVGLEHDFAMPRAAPGADDFAAVINDPHGWLARIAPDEPGCPLCAAAAEAVARGKLVFAAAGNNPQIICCPARAQGVVAVGFQHEDRQVITRLDGTLLENAAAAGTAYESMTWDTAIDEIDGVLGTSFACPLYAGVGALGIGMNDLQGYLASNRFGTLAMAFHSELRAGQANPDAVQTTRQFYDATLQRLPHVHCAAQARLRPDLAATPAASCWSCGLLAEDKYVNAGLFCLETGRTDDAAGLLEAAAVLAPWSADAAANLGRTCEIMGRLGEALDHYDRALSLRPGFMVYATERERIRQALRGSTKH